MPKSLALLVLFFSVGLTGCYHQVVRTGAPPGPVVVERPWTATWLFGLVEASPINTAAQCPNGIAIVETRQSFANGLVGGLTLGIYTPQTVRITCATGPVSIRDGYRIDVPVAASPAQREAALRDGIELARRTGEAVGLTGW